MRLQDFLSFACLTIVGVVIAFPVSGWAGVIGAVIGLVCLLGMTGGSNRKNRRRFR